MNNKEKKGNLNKGFSLVELIVVISIMAVVLGILGPEYIKFVEKSRESYDLNNYNLIANAIKINGTDIGAIQIVDGTISFTTLGSITATNNAVAVLAQYGIDLTTFKTKSKKYGTATFTIVVPPSRLPEITVNNTDLAAAMQISVTP